MNTMNDPFFKKKKKKKTLLLEIDQEIFNMMLAKSMHQIARIEFRNSKFPYARGLCPLATPARGLCPLDPCRGASSLEPPSLVNNLGPPFPAAGSAPVARFIYIMHRPTTSGRSYCESTQWKNTMTLCRISRWFMPGFMVNVKNVLNVYIILWRLEKYNLQL